MLQDLGVTVHVPQRGAQIMGNRISEGFQLLVEIDELNCPLGDPLLQFGVQAANLVLDFFAVGDFLLQKLLIAIRGLGIEVGPGAGAMHYAAEENTDHARKQV